MNTTSQITQWHTDTPSKLTLLKDSYYNVNLQRLLYFSDENKLTSSSYNIIVIIIIFIIIITIIIIIIILVQYPYPDNPHSCLFRFIITYLGAPNHKLAATPNKVQTQDYPSVIYYVIHVWFPL